MTTQPVPEILCVEDVITCMQQGLLPEFLLFWGHRPSKNGGINKSCLSQWFEASFVIDGATYHTAEHYMMASKARLFDDAATCAQILATQTPHEAKALGRKISGFDDEKWNAARFDIVVQANIAKFSQNQALAHFLLSTRHKVLVEASPMDAVWGIGLAAEDPRAQNPGSWEGLNLLGFALMAARAHLRNSP